MIEVFQEGDEYVAADAEALVHAFGATPKEARANLVRNRDDLRARLVAAGDKLSPAMHRLRESLSEIQDIL